MMGLRTEVASYDAFLRANSETYEWLVGKTQAIVRRGGVEAVLRCVEKTARFAAEFHSGRFADGAIENVALQIGAELDNIVTGTRNFPFPVPHRDSRRRVLHVTSGVQGIGGHTRMLYHWVRNDRSSCHSVVIVNQGDEPIPFWLSEAIQSNGGKLVVFPLRSYLCQKAHWLRELARRSADLVVLHHNAYDVVPTVAFAVHECPPVAVLNHADHQFWLSSTVADMVINLRMAASKHTAERRFLSCNTLLPIPLSYPAREISRLDARRALGIDEDQVVLLSIGREIKYRPCGPYDFVDTANKILDRHPSTHLYVVGESAAGISPYLRCEMHNRLHFVGKVDDPTVYRAAADIYMESFPFGSQTALLEAALCGLPVVPAYAPLFPLLVANDDAVNDILLNPYNEEKFVERVDLLIQQPEQRVEIGGTLQKRLLVGHVGEGWLTRLAAMYLDTDSLKHNPRPIPISACKMMDADISLSLFDVMADGKTDSVRVLGEDVGAVLRHTAFVAKWACNYSKARRVAWQAVQYDPKRRASWRLLAVSLLGGLAPFIQRIRHLAWTKYRRV